MQQPAFLFRKAVETDLESLVDLSKKTFFDSFADQNSPDDMERFIQQAFSSSKLRDELKNPDSQFWLVMAGEQAVGYLKINFGAAQSDLHDELSLEIERIYLLKEYQGMRIGRELIEKAIQIALDSGLKYIWLGVWEKNEKAIRFYHQNGFQRFGSHTFILGTDPQIDLLMKLDLTYRI